LDRKSAVLTVLASAVLGLSACAAGSSQLGLRETAWLASDGQLEALSTERYVDRETLLTALLNSDFADGNASPVALRNDLLAGEFLFKAPLLLGGQAAKAGISCHSCHVNGTDNPHFLFPAISSVPGTADTTHSFFSKSLGNQVFDPIVIPDLTKAGKVDHNERSGELEDFLTTIVVGEFSGEAAVPTVIAPLATYVRALRLSGSDQAEAIRPRELLRDLDDLGLTVGQATHRLSVGEGEVAALLLSSAQSQIQAIYERLHRPSHARLREWLIARSREMGGLRQRLNAGEEPPRREFIALQERLSSGPDFSLAADDSLYNAKAIANVLRQ
jgi:hypothetical protein